MIPRPLHPIRVPLPAQGLSATRIVRPTLPAPVALSEALAVTMAAFASGVHKNLREVNQAIAARTAQVGPVTVDVDPAEPGVMVVVDEASELLARRTLPWHGRDAFNRSQAALNELYTTGYPPAPAAAPVAPQPPVLPDGVRIIEPPHEWRPLPNERAVSLCGGIPGVDPWHDPVAVQLAHRYATVYDATTLPLAILIPRRRDVVRHPDGTTTVAGEPWSDRAQAAQVDWENRHIRPRDGVALFWFPQSTDQYVMPTTILELGMAWGAGFDLVVGAHPFYARRDILVHQVPHMDLELHNTVDATITGVIRQLEHVLPATGALPRVRPLQSFFPQIGQ